MATNVKLGVDLGGFNAGIKQAQNQIKTMNATMRLADAQFKATGNSEAQMAQKTQALTGKMSAQKALAAQYEAALKAMTQAGVDPASAAFQRMTQGLLAAQTGMAETQAAMNELSGGATEAASSADRMSTSLQGIGKKLSFDQVISGIDRITGSMEKAAKKAVELGKQLWENIVDAAQYSDDVNTQAAILGMNVEDYQAYKQVFDTFADITVQDWDKAKKKVQSAIVNTSSQQFDIFAALGVGLRDVNGTVSPYYNKYVTGKAREWEDVFWDVGAALREKVANGSLSQDQADVYAQAIFGKSWDNLNTIFEMGREAFQQAVADQTVVSEESIKKNAELNDQLTKLQQDFNNLKVEVVGGLAPALTAAAQAIDSLLTSIMDYLQTEEGKQMLEDLGTAVSGLFKDLSDIDPQQVVEGFAGVFNGIVDGLKWLNDNKQSVIEAMKFIVAGWAGLKLTGGALTVLKLVNGIQGLKNSGGAQNTLNNYSGGNAGNNGTSGMPPTQATTPLNTGGATGPVSVTIAGPLPLHVWVENQTAGTGNGGNGTGNGGGTPSLGNGGGTPGLSGPSVVPVNLGSGGGSALPSGSTPANLPAPNNVSNLPAPNNVPNLNAPGGSDTIHLNPEEFVIGEEVARLTLGQRIGSFLGSGLGKLTAVGAGLMLGWGLGGVIEGQGFNLISHTTDDESTDWWKEQQEEAARQAWLNSGKYKLQQARESGEEINGLEHIALAIGAKDERDVAAWMLAQAKENYHNEHALMGITSSVAPETAQALREYREDVENGEYIPEERLEELADQVWAQFSEELQEGKGEIEKSPDQETVTIAKTVNPTQDEFLDMLYSSVVNAAERYNPETNTKNTTEYFDEVIWPRIQDAGRSKGLDEDTVAAIADQFHDAWIGALFDPDYTLPEGGFDGLLKKLMEESGEEPALPVAPELDPAATQEELNKLGAALSLPVNLTIGGLGSLLGGFMLPKAANGLPYVPRDNFLALLHKGEQVVPARQVSSRNYSSNLYVEHMHMSSGQDAQGLADRMAAAQKWTQGGYGS